MVAHQCHDVSMNKQYCEWGSDELRAAIELYGKTVDDTHMPVLEVILQTRRAYF